MQKKAQVLPPTRQDLMRYMVEDSALANAHVTNPLTHMGVGTAVGTPIGALIGAIVAKNRGETTGKGAIAGAILGGLAGLGAGTISGGIKGSFDIIQNKKRRAKHALNFVSSHGVNDINNGIVEYPEYKAAEAKGAHMVSERGWARRDMLKQAGLVSDYVVDKLPGYGSHAIEQRRLDTVRGSDQSGTHGTANALAETIGGYTGPLVGAGVGGLAGYGIDKARGGDGGAGAIGGAIAGAVIPQLIGAIVAGIRRRRTQDEQVMSDSAGRAAAKYVVPGLATYDSLKRLGASENYQRDMSRGNKKQAEVKQAGGFLDSLTGTFDKPGILSKLMADEHLRRALVGAGISGATAALSSDDHKLRNGLLAALGGGAATYGASRSGVLDNMLSTNRTADRWMKNRIRGANARMIARKLHGSDPNSVQENMLRAQEKMTDAAVDTVKQHGWRVPYYGSASFPQA